MLIDVAKYYSWVFTSNYKNMVTLELKETLDSLSGLAPLYFTEPQGR